MDTQIIYGDGDKNVFQLEDFTYYLTKSGKPKKYDKNFKRYSITKEEYDNCLKKYKSIFY